MTDLERGIFDQLVSFLRDLEAATALDPRREVQALRERALDILAEAERVR